MQTSQNAFQLIIAGNTNVPAMVNVITRATLRLRESEQESAINFQQIHIFHTEQSLQSLMTSKSAWRDALDYYHIPSTSLVHHVTRLDDENIERFRDLVEQLRTIVDPLQNTHYYIDLTGGVASLKAILTVFAYVLDIQNIYTLEIKFTGDFENQKRQRGLFLHELESKDVPVEYRKFPPIKDFDEFGKRNYTEILRHRQIVAELLDKLSVLLPTFDLDHLRTSLLSGIHSRLLGEFAEGTTNYRHSVFSSSAGVEEIANIIIEILKINNMGKGNLGDKLIEVNKFFAQRPKYFMDQDTFQHFTKLISSTRNEIVHPKQKTGDEEIVAIQAELSSHLAITFLKFALKAITSFLDERGNLVKIEPLDPQQDIGNEILYFGFDGDATGDYLEEAFNKPTQSEAEVLERSQQIRSIIKTLANLIRKRTKNKDTILFAEGDNILFKTTYQPILLGELQKMYRETMGLSSSIGYGKTLREAMIALHLAKAQPGDSMVGITIENEES